MSASNEDIVRRYLAAHERHEDDTLAELRAPEWAYDIPQSGERIRGHANDRAIMASWPGGRPAGRVGRILGSEDQWVVSPSWTYQRVKGEGEVWFADAVAKYPDGSTWIATVLVELRGGKVRHETWYFGQAFEAPAWRAQWVERFDPAERNDGA